MRYRINNNRVSAHQTHPQLLFETNSKEQAKFWAELGCYVVFDKATGNVCHSALDIELDSFYKGN